MDKYKNIERLLQLYWAGKTSVEEESTLRHFFTSEVDIPKDLQPYAELFIFQQKQGEERLSDGFEARLLQRMEDEKELRNVSRPKLVAGDGARNVFRNPLLLKVAAGIVLVLGIGLLGYRGVEQRQVRQLAQAEARATIIDALGMLSDNLQKGELMVDNGLKQLELLESLMAADDQ